MRFAALLVLPALAAAACSSSSNGAASDGGVDAPTSDAVYVPPAACSCPSGQELLLFAPPGWCSGATPTGGASCGTQGCYVECFDGSTADGASSGGTTDAAGEAASDAATDAAGEAASDAGQEAAADAASDAGAD